MRQKQKKSYRSIALLITGAVLCVGLIVAGIAYRNKDQKPATNSGVNLQPATKQEIADSEQHKEDIVKQGETPTPDPTTRKAVTPFVVDASQYDATVEVRAYVPDTVESNGSCTVTFTKDGKTVTRQAISQPDATTTRCPNVAIPRSEFPTAGTWQVVVSYASAASTGSSKPQAVEIK